MKNNFFNFLKIKFLNDIIFYQTIIFCLSLLFLGTFFIINFKDNFIHSIVDQELKSLRQDGIAKICDKQTKRTQFYILNANRTIRCAAPGFKIEDFKNIVIGGYDSDDKYIYHHRVLHSKGKSYTLFLRVESDALKLISSEVFSKLFMAMGILGILFIAGQFFLFRHYFTPLYDLFHIFRMKGVIDTTDSRDYWDYIESKSIKNFNKRRKLQRDLFNTKQYYSVIINSIDDPVVVTDSKGKIIFCNNAFRKSFAPFNGRYRGAELISIIRDYDFINLIKKHGHQANLIHNTQIALTKVSGKTNSFQLKISDIESKNKNKEILFYFSDITKLQDVNNMRRDFFENVSHEIKTPLTSIKGYTQTLKSINTDEDQQEIMDIVIQNVDRLDELINGILSLSKIENEGRIEVEEINLPSFINALINDQQLKINAKDMSVNYSQTGPETIVANGKLLYHCISNLVSNAIKYSKDSTVITIESGQRDNHQYIAITDEGVGIPNDKIARIFERFYRVDQSRSINTGGTGLGLAIAKHSAQKMKASIEVESMVDKGTTFTVLFPIKS
ncbi:ATP-binding protein [Halobacteriovorax sp. GFR7]|uniref:sensor histidine kinase n=1 Tax=unclassified Halobacteriovorax TaxID=2639665 RepID=UPI003710B693